MAFLSKQADMIEAFKWTSFRISIILTLKKWSHIYPTELQLNIAYSTDTDAPCLNLHSSMSSGFISSKHYYKRDDFDFDIFNFLFLNGDVPRASLCSHFSTYSFLQEFLIIWLTSMPVTKLWLPNFFNRGISIINFGKRFLSFNVDITNYFFKYNLDSNHFCYKAYSNLTFMATWYIKNNCRYFIYSPVLVKSCCWFKPKFSDILV